MTPERFRQISELYHAALERPSATRATFLAEACAPDETLRAQVEALLDANEKSDGLLDGPADWQPALAAAEGIRPQQQFDHYQVIARLGAGGMGEVWRARDLKLRREVAIKILPVAVSHLSDRLHRFEQEARAASALNHPNILTIYEIGEAALPAGRVHYIASELVEGRTILQHVKDETPALETRLELASQVAAALAAAHEAGIVHRDIKPDNVMVRRDGLVKVLDFGLAKLVETRSAEFERQDSEAETLLHSSDTPRPAFRTPHSTEPGTVMGTPQYMSPEQARGQDVDARTDIFSLGLLLYEMFAGTPAFTGVNSLDVISAILRTEPAPLARLWPDVPPDLEHIVAKAMRKDRERRYQSARDLLIDLKDLQRDLQFQSQLDSKEIPAASKRVAVTTGEVTPQITEETKVVAPLRSRRTVAISVANVLVLLVVGWLAWQRFKPAPALDLTALRAVELARWRSAPSEDYVTGSFSPEGKWVAFNSTESGPSNIWFKPAAQGDPKAVTSDQFTNLNPVWSPNGDEVAFYSQRGDQTGFWRVPVTGGATTLIKKLDANEVNARLKSWPQADVIYYDANRQLFALQLSTGKSEPVTKLDTARIIARSVSLSRDATQAAWAATGEPNEKGVWVSAANGGAKKLISPPNMQARNTLWHPDGRRVIFSGNVSGTFQLFMGYAEGGAATQLTFGETNLLALDVYHDERNGTRVLYGAAKEEADVWGVNVATREEFPLATELGAELWPVVAPDSKTVVWQDVKNLSQGDKLINSQLWAKTNNGRAQQLAAEGFAPQWSPDGKQLAFLRKQGNVYGLWSVSAAGGAERQLAAAQVAFSGETIMPYNRLQTTDYSWSPDGQRLAYVSTKNGANNLWLVTAEGKSETSLTTNTESALIHYCPLWSGDGQRLAFTTTTFKRAADAKMSFNGAVLATDTRAVRTLIQSGTYLRLLGWLPNDRELLYATVNRPGGIATPSEIKLLAVNAETGMQRDLAVLTETYLYNIQLSADRHTIAFAARRGGKDDVWLMPVSGGAARKLTANQDPRLYYAGLAWSPDGQTIYFSKQLRHSWLAMLTGFD
ncbi:MAG: serine/threonine-protein kinase [Acidobacteria bacterium]|nr:serine/threonine-protein kinase [Acidobacteriota bacterium]